MATRKQTQRRRAGTMEVLAVDSKGNEFWFNWDSLVLCVPAPIPAGKKRFLLS
jgi:hypothetical protein